MFHSKALPLLQPTSVSRKTDQPKEKLPGGALTRRAAIAGVIFSGLSASTRAAAQLTNLRGSLNGLDVGLIRNGASDQTSLMQHAINEATANGKALFLPGGEYLVSNLFLPSRCQIIGHSNQTRLIFHGAGGHLLTSRNTADIDLEGLHFDGAGQFLGEAPFGLLHFTNVDNLRLEDCKVSGSSRNGISLDHVSGRISDCHISNCLEAGVRSMEARGLSFTQNTVQDCANAGILVYRWKKGEDGTLISGNRIERIAARSGGTGQFGNGINVFRADGVVISGNRVTDCAFSAIRSNAGSNVTINGNSCLRSGETAIYSEFGFQGAIISSNLIDGGTMGISIANFLDGGRLAVCSGNLIRNLSAIGPYPPEVQGFGIGIAAEADTTITGNVVEGAPRFGLHLGWGPYLRDVIAAQNILRKCGTGIGVTVVEGADSAIIANNIIRGTQNGAIIGYRWSEPSTGELTQKGGAQWPHLDISGNSVAR